MKSQGLQANQQVTFLSDGADDVRELPLYLSPESEHWLDWFHVAMRFRVMGQMAKGLVNEQNMTSAQEPLTEAAEELDTVDIGKQLERVKWFLWHGNVVRALDTIEDIEDELALIVGGSFAVISFFWAYIYSRNAHRVAIIGGIVTAILLFAGTIPRALSAWRGVALGDTVKWFAALTISLVILGSIPLFAALLRAVRMSSGH